ncbi:pilus (MSHA type) biogenesis protein MshL [Vibrio barjaei]|uniref:Pilus (MSHA type) biogenesis protein MshL n=1 Tax=Vibrio barjaei TaxID=1676683 RepID=A0ABW7IM83_9VIBR|nr:pilus (MSHA type) biogenesis protein MshL [Vibrio barjaei]MCG9785789.1 pilus (MSHA type) biogenesis protein MshL [Vibrio mediterranei]MCY9869656.1 pilus (MSHA type) biogenesis protein MshL [Vibrio barjaei]OIN28037.1 pilus (MSHA type) biogenesis protein MshL [Vibrio barjaei]
MRKVVVGICIAALVGCSMGHRDPVEIKQSLNESVNNANNKSLDELPPTVEADLMPELDAQTGSHSSRTLKRFRVQANGVEAKAFFTSLVKGTEYSVSIHPSVSGKITANLSDVTLDEVLDNVSDMYGYDIEKKGRIIQVYPAGLRTVSIPVDYLQFKRSGRSLTSITTGTISSRDSSNNNNSSNSNNNSNSSSSNSSSSSSSNNVNGGNSNNNEQGGTRIETTSESDFWPALEQAVSKLIGTGDGRSVVVTPQASLLTLRAYPDEIRQVREFLDMSQQRLHRQVILEAKILEVTLSDGYQQGISWSNIGAAIGSGGVSISRPAQNPVPPLNQIGTLLGGQTNVTITDGHFEAVLSFMATQGDLNVLSSPRITAANNQKSVIKVGTDEYFVTDISTVIGSGENANVAPQVELTPFFSGISLDVTPQIDEKGNVLLHVHPAVIEVQEEKKEIEVLGDSIIVPLAKSSIRESDSVIRAADGDVVVIGGLMKSATTEMVSKVPYLGDIPALGHLFRNTQNVTEKTELVILLRPTVVGVNTWQKEVERSRDLLNEWFPED